MSEILRSVRKPYIDIYGRVIMYTYICFNWFLVSGISLPAAQLFLIATKSILRRGVGSGQSNGLILDEESGFHCSSLALRELMDV